MLFGWGDAALWKGVRKRARTRSSERVAGVHTGGGRGSLRPEICACRSPDFSSSPSPVPLSLSSRPRSSDSCRCDNISTCLDGYAEKPTLAQCVALGPLNGNSPFRLHESDPSSTLVSVELTTPSGNITGAIPIADVFIWVRKAGEFVKACATRFSNEG